MQFMFSLQPALGLLSQQVNKLGFNLEAFAVTEFNETFSGRQQRQDVKVSRRFGH
jgi:hypothetical protein